MIDMKRFFASILMVTSFAIFATVVNAEPVKLEVVDKKTTGRAAPGEMIIEIKSGVVELGRERGVVPLEKVNVQSELIKSLNKKYNLISIERLFSGTRKDEPSDIYLFRFSSKADMMKLLQDYKKDSNVIYAEPNYMVRALKTKEEKE